MPLTRTASGTLMTLASMVFMTRVVDGQYLTAVEQIAQYEPEEFTYALGAPEPDDLVDGFQYRGVNVNQLPSLQGHGVSMALLNLDACAINLPHVHPRATEMFYAISGEVRVAFVQENGGDGAVVNDLAAGDVTFFPQGLIHYQQNLGCEPATYTLFLNSEDPGSVTITSRFFELPSEAIEASLNVMDPELQYLVDSLPELPGDARARCLKKCESKGGKGSSSGSMDDDDSFGSFSYRF